MSKPVIRRVEQSDEPEWQRLWAAYNAFYGREGDTALSGEIIETAWMRLLDGTETVYGVVAELDGKLIGLGHLIFHRNMIQIAETCYMQDLFTTVEARGRGVGRMLMSGIADMRGERGVCDIYWHTHIGIRTKAIGQRGIFTTGWRKTPSSPSTAKVLIDCSKAHVA
ncbi:GNAT family N-acetyltransferase [Yoonia sp. R2-816]|uniref:GNAT family N-acetyltransferase n=1 Tax=Yoonia sp. R2-816 TaxID=3342638 RepID=UPI00372843D5